MGLLSEAARAADMRGVPKIGVGAHAGDRGRRGSGLSNLIWLQADQGGAAALGGAECRRLPKVEVLASGNCYSCAKDKKSIEKFTGSEKFVVGGRFGLLLVSHEHQKSYGACETLCFESLAGTPLGKHYGKLG
ncbi:MAG: hypothetical protein E5V89_11115 [Mesorhizobium sp.]|nr:MAG: hypothetical protein E5V89_11115 [Mesorhizobium sp.]